MRHIAVEDLLMEKAQQAQGDVPLAVTARLRLEHGVISALLQTSPSRERAAKLKALLQAHHHLEEDPGGLYERCEELLADQLDAILDQARAHPEPALGAYRDDPRIWKPSTGQSPSWASRCSRA